MNRFVTHRWFPCGILVANIYSWCLQYQYVCCDDDLLITYSSPRMVARARFAKRAMDGFSCMYNQSPYWMDYVLHQRHMRAKYGLEIPQ